MFTTLIQQPNRLNPMQGTNRSKSVILIRQHMQLATHKR